jgi:hypothetical protein
MPLTMKSGVCTEIFVDFAGLSILRRFAVRVDSPHERVK